VITRNEGPSAIFSRGLTEETELQARQGIEYARMYRVPAPEVLVPLSGLVAVVGALSVILGIWADLGALLLISFLLPVAFFMHAFWREADEQMKANQMAHFKEHGDGRRRARALLCVQPAPGRRRPVDYRSALRPRLIDNFLLHLERRMKK
jgi:hypothetical protein